MRYPKPNLIVSRCLGFEACRYNNQIINNDFVQSLVKHAHISTVCPEVGIGLGVPRVPVRLVLFDDDTIHMIQNGSGKDFTQEMELFAEVFLVKQDDIDGFILKNRSPSCAINDCKLYRSDNNSPVGKEAGLFASKAHELFPNTIIEDEGRLSNFLVRDHFLTQIYTIARFRKIKKAGKMSELIEFQSQNKLLFLAYNEVAMRELGRITANNRNKSIDEVIDEYEKVLYRIFSKTAQYTTNINVLMHAFGHFSNVLSSDEKSFFLYTLEKYRNNKVPLSVPKNILYSWIIKYDNDYLEQQTYFSPYPEDLVEIKDSGKGR